MRPVSDWFRRFSADPQAVALVVILAVGTGIVLLLGEILAPVFAALIIAYLLEGLVKRLQRLNLPRLPAVFLVFSLFSGFALILLIGLLPIITRQLTQLVRLLPNMILKGQELLLDLPARYPQLISEAQVRAVIESLRGEITTFGQVVLSWSLASVVGVITIAVYLFVVPLLVFFFMKDKERIVDWVRGMLPDHHSLAKRVWHDVDVQIGNYVRGKFWEILIVWAAAYVVFAFMQLQFTMLLAFLVGLSVLVPYIGVTVVSVPIALVGYFQWGLGSDFYWLIGAYAIVQILDANVLVPLLFSEVVNLHPIAIIVAVLGFGGIWGFWGLFFAIPLATLLKAVLKAWPRHHELEAKLASKSPAERAQAGPTEPIVR